MKKKLSLLSMTLVLVSFCMNSGKAQQAPNVFEAVEETSEGTKKVQATDVSAMKAANQQMQQQQEESQTQTDTTETSNTPKEEVQYNVNAAKQSAKQSAKQAAKEAAGIPEAVTGQVIKTEAQDRAHQAKKEAVVKEVHAVHASK